MKYRAVVFDLDDTLIPESQYVESGFHHVAKLLSVRTNEDEAAVYARLMRLRSTSIGRVFNRFFEELGLPYDDSDIRELVGSYRSHAPCVSFYSDVLPCLSELKLHGVKTGIITDGYVETQRNKLRAVGAYERFDCIMITEELGREYWKPHPRPFELMSHNLGVRLDQMVYVGDNPEKDFYISDIYPITTVRVLRGGIYMDKAYRGGIREHHTVRSLSEICRIL